jgi:hypothetical protein
MRAIGILAIAVGVTLAAGGRRALEQPTVPPGYGEVNASTWPGHQGEVSIAADRVAPGRVVAASMNPEDGRLLTMASEDGGHTWSRNLLPLPTGAQLHADPMVAFDSLGRVHLAVIPVAPGNRAQGIELLRSLDGGRTWSAPVRISKATARDDKVALAVDDNPDSRYRDRIHVAWKWPSGGLFYAASTDGGEHFMRPKLIDVAKVSGLDVAVGADGELYVAASDGGERVMRVLRSVDGGASFSASIVVAPVRAQWYTSQPSHCRRQSLVHASIAVDQSGGPLRGQVYLTWADYPSGSGATACTNGCDTTAACRTEVFLARSNDHARTWTTPQALPGQQLGTDRYFQWSRVDPSTGALYVAYKDTRLDPRRVATDVYLQRSADGGLSWEPAVRLSGASSDASAASFQYGDYQGLAVSTGRVYAAWSDYRVVADGEIFVGRAVFPLASPTPSPPNGLGRGVRK